MAKFRVSQDADYVMGHLRYGHREGVIEAASLEDARKKVEQEENTDFMGLVVDDYSVDDVSYGSNEFEYEEMKCEECDGSDTANEN